MRVSVSPVKTAGSRGYLTGSYREAREGQWGGSMTVWSI